MSSNGLADSKVESFEDKILCQAGQVDFKLDHFNRSILSFESFATTIEFRLILLQLFSRYDTINVLGIQQAAATNTPILKSKRPVQFTRVVLSLAASFRWRCNLLQRRRGRKVLQDVFSAVLSTTKLLCLEVSVYLTKTGNIFAEISTSAFCRKQLTPMPWS